MLDIDKKLKNLVRNNSLAHHKGASVQRQFEWFKMPVQQKVVARILESDTDSDGVPDKWDCQPRNPRKQGGEAYWQYLANKGIVIYGPNSSKKQVRGIFEKHPELIQQAQGLHIRTGIDNGANSSIIAGFDPSYGPGKYQILLNQNFQGNLTMNRGSFGRMKNYPHHEIIRHELQHVQDEQNLSAEQLRDEQQQQISLNNQYMDVRKGAVGVRSKRYKEYAQKYYQLPGEARALAAEGTVPQRKQQLSQEEIDRAWNDYNNNVS